ncbi:hypothetical protein IMG5_199310 [Ichthyophthirius multifiliis]|uniref:non-specific serine/threonine protein kinase n=1 Tax=Ichthyophthirius multifiliis TaxID=5932 RepID=G0R5J1_ICHMU|nr:hypothetical protein IMG5_199310 [Ichthyophthirius multifiliis]EGR27251.1 hypothetical protein IMG5_199310 [Ichthyophthirius multifiliis]|eukprot:XP_004024135.1 hypothetical protein IMG5_199310 [Ichthyophthirius multifiliis]
MPKQYSNYEDYEIQWGQQDDYEVLKNIGKGKYSEVFEGINVINKQKVVIKILKPVRINKIKREIKILQMLKGGPNIIELLDVVRDNSSQTPSLIFEYIENTDFKSMFPKLTDFDIRHYLYEILKSLEFCHSKGIMHRDIKPQNVIVNPKLQILKVIDWGLAEFYHPYQDYNVRVASRYFKGPELLTDNIYYDYSLDIWSTGCLFGAMVLYIQLNTILCFFNNCQIFMKEPLFQGQDNRDQLVKIAKILGTEDLFQYVQKYDLKLDPYYKALGKQIQLYIYQIILIIRFFFFSQPKKQWSNFINQENKQNCNELALDLLSQMLIYDHVYYFLLFSFFSFNQKALRITPKDAMQHPYFDLIRKQQNQ